MALDTGKIRDFVQKTWDQSIVPTLHEYVKIPAKSPMFDAQWREHGHIDRAVELLRGWAGERPIEGLSIEVVRLEGRTPVLLMEAPGTGPTRCCSTVTSTSSPRWSGGPRAPARGRRCAAATSSTAAASATTATPPS